MRPPRRQRSFEEAPEKVTEKDAPFSVTATTGSGSSADTMKDILRVSRLATASAAAATATRSSQGGERSKRKISVTRARSNIENIGELLDEIIGELEETDVSNSSSFSSLTFLENPTPTVIVANTTRTVQQFDK